jgi:hypothetical protein
LLVAVYLKKEGIKMPTAGQPTIAIGSLAIGAGIVGLFGLVSIALFFSVGQPFGSINEFIGMLQY